ncbi:hypothetical protein P7C70_g2244, partial [Phenoliferia sp. Uapishka_3]
MTAAERYKNRAVLAAAGNNKPTSRWNLEDEQAFAEKFWSAGQPGKLGGGGGGTPVTVVDVRLRDQSSAVAFFGDRTLDDDDDDYSPELPSAAPKNSPAARDSFSFSPQTFLLPVLDNFLPPSRVRCNSANQLIKRKPVPSLDRITYTGVSEPLVYDIISTSDAASLVNVSASTHESANVTDDLHADEFAHPPELYYSSSENSRSSRSYSPTFQLDSFRFSKESTKSVEDEGRIFGQGAHRRERKERFEDKEVPQGRSKKELGDERKATAAWTLSLSAKDSTFADDFISGRAESGHSGTTCSDETDEVAPDASPLDAVAHPLIGPSRQAVLTFGPPPTTERSLSSTTSSTSNSGPFQLRRPSLPGPFPFRARPMPSQGISGPPTRIRQASNRERDETYLTAADFELEESDAENMHEVEDGLPSSVGSPFWDGTYRPDTDVAEEEVDVDAYERARKASLAELFPWSIPTSPLLPSNVVNPSLAAGSSTTSQPHLARRGSLASTASNSDQASTSGSSLLSLLTFGHTRPRTSSIPSLANPPGITSLRRTSTPQTFPTLKTLPPRRSSLQNHFAGTSWVRSETPTFPSSARR